MPLTTQERQKIKEDLRSSLYNGSTQSSVNSREELLQRIQLRRDLLERGSEPTPAQSGIPSSVPFPSQPGIDTPIEAGSKAIRNLPASAFNFGKGVFNALTNPIETVKGIAGVGAGAVETLAEKTGLKEDIGDSSNEQSFDSFASAMKERFGSLDALQKTATEDPFGFGADVLGLVTGLGGGARLANTANKVRPLPSVRNKISEKLSQSAAENITNVLQPTKQKFKDLTRKVAPELAERKVVAFSREGLEKRVARELEDAGQRLDDVLDSIPPETRVDVMPIVNALEESKKKFVIDGTNVIAEPRAYKAATELQEVVAQLGDRVPFKSLRNLRQIWDKAVDKSNGFQKQLSDLDTLDLKKTATNAIRAQLSREFPKLSDINAEYTLWKRTSDILEETAKRKTGQRKPLGERAAGGTGFLGGIAAGGGLVEALGSGALLRGFVAMINSPVWKTSSAKYKAQVAEALVTNNTTKLKSLMRKAGIAEVIRLLDESSEE